MSKYTFQKFMKDVDENVSQKSGVGVHCLPDIDFHDFGGRELMRQTGLIW